jgi:hypothetical protein
MSYTIDARAIDVSLPLMIRFFDLFQTDERVIVEWKSSEEHPVSLFNGRFHYECGEGETFTIQGKPGFCSAVLSELGRNGLMIDKRPLIHSTSRFWIHLSGKRT